MPLTFAKLSGEWRHIVEDYITGPDRELDGPGVHGTVRIVPLVNGMPDPYGWTSEGKFYTVRALTLNIVRGQLFDPGMSPDIDVCVAIDGKPVVWTATFDVRYRRQRIPLDRVHFGPNNVVDGGIVVSALTS